MSERLIVIIDDDKVFLTLAGAILESVGYEVRTVSDSVEAKRYILSGEKPAMIIVDVMMPALKGDEVAILLKENVETASIPVLFVSGMSVEELDELTRKTGADGYLSKPFSFNQLVESVRRIVP
jgi:twitching motility two-component system response regulator PilG